MAHFVRDEDGDLINLDLVAVLLAIVENEQVVAYACRDEAGEEFARIAVEEIEHALGHCRWTKEGA